MVIDYNKIRIDHELIKILQNLIECLPHEYLSIFIFTISLLSSVAILLPHGSSHMHAKLNSFTISIYSGRLFSAQPAVSLMVIISFRVAFSFRTLASLFYGPTLPSLEDLLFTTFSTFTPLWTKNHEAQK